MAIIPKFIDEAASKPAQAVGETLKDIWQLGIGSHVALWAKKQEHRHKLNLEDYIDRIQNKTQDIPEEFLIEPQLNIVGPALEASKYYIDSEILREMFANLISSCVDQRKYAKTHPSFVEIIKQLSPLDAEILCIFQKKRHIPLISLEAVKSDAHYFTLQQHIMDSHDKVDYKKQVSSISNLQRLGLVDISYMNFFSISSAYDYIESHPALESALQQVNEHKISEPDTRLNKKKGICTKTPLCDDFLEICLV